MVWNAANTKGYSVIAVVLPTYAGVGEKAMRVLGLCRVVWTSLATRTRVCVSALPRALRALRNLVAMGSLAPK